MKTCRTCGERKPLDAFFRNKPMPDGRVNHCKNCYKSKRNMAKERMHKTKWERKNPLKHRAHKRIEQLIYRGYWKRGDCEACGKPKAEAHHDDYTKPLEVRWLCSKHHREHHRNTAPTQSGQGREGE